MTTLADFKRVNNDQWGNPRFVVSWLALGMYSYEANAATRSLGLKKYRGKDFGGGFVFQSYTPEADLKRFKAEIAEYERKEWIKSLA